MRTRAADLEHGTTLCKLLNARERIIRRYPQATPEMLDAMIRASRRAGVKDL